MAEYTEQSIVAAINEGAHSVSAIARAHGVKGNPSGSVCKRIRTVVPGVGELIEQAKAGEPVGQPEQTPEPEQTEATQPQAEHKARAVRNGENGSPFRPGTKIDLVYQAGAGTELRPLTEVLDEVAKSNEFKALTKDKEGKTLPLGTYPKGKDRGSGRRQRAYWQYTMIASGKHPTNDYRVRSVEEGRGLDNKQARFEPVPENEREQARAAAQAKAAEKAAAAATA